METDPGRGVKHFNWCCDWLLCVKQMWQGASCMLPVGVERAEGGVLVGAGCLSRCSSCAAANISAPRREKSASSGGGALKPLKANVCLCISLLLLHKQNYCSVAFCSLICSNVHTSMCGAIWPLAPPPPWVLKHCMQDNNMADELACKKYVPVLPSSCLRFLPGKMEVFLAPVWVRGQGSPKAPTDNVEGNRVQ